MHYLNCSYNMNFKCDCILVIKVFLLETHMHNIKIMSPFQPELLSDSLRAAEFEHFKVNYKFNFFVVS